MNRRVESCSTSEMMRDFARGNIGDPLRQKYLAEHLEQCAHCSTAISAFGESEDAFVARLRKIAGWEHSIAPEVDESSTDSLLQRILEIGESSNGKAQTDAQAVDTHGSIASKKQTMEAELPGNTIIGPYQLVGKIGSGGMGTVYEAVHRKMNRTVALKLHPVDWFYGAPASLRFEREIQVIGQLSHPNIVLAFDAGEANGYFFIAMELLDGIDLSKLMRHRNTPLSPANATEIVLKAAAGLGHVHSRGIFHRDIKLANIMLCKNTHPSFVNVKLLDVGLARQSEDQESITWADQIMGTIDYMAPEQCLDSRDADVRSDIYSLGATLFRLLTGQSPLSCLGCQTQGRKIKALLCSEMPSIRSVQPELSGDLISIIDRMLRSNPNDRFQNTAELVDALTPFALGANLAELVPPG